MWRRDWSRLALLRTSRWQNRGTAPRPASIGRTITQPPLRLFGAGRRPGPSTATALPRSLPFVLRLKPPSRPVGPPMLTMQSEVPVEADPRIQPAPAIEASETSPPIHPETQLAPAAGQASLEALTVRREAQAPASLVSRVLRIFRRPSPQSVSEEPTVAPQADSPPHPEEAPPTEPMPVSLQTPGQAAVARSPQAKTQPEAQPLVVRRSVEPTAEVSPEPAPARQADQAEAPSAASKAGRRAWRATSGSAGTVLRARSKRSTTSQRSAAPGRASRSRRRRAVHASACLPPRAGRKQR